MFLISGMSQQYDSNFGKHLHTFPSFKEASILVVEQFPNGANIERIASSITVNRLFQVLAEDVCESSLLNDTTLMRSAHTAKQLRLL